MLVGQDLPPKGGEIEDAQIIIEKDKDLTLPTASRIYKRTKVKSVYVDIQQLDFQITQPTFEFRPHLPIFNLRDYQPSEADKSIGYQNFVKLGYGNYNSPLAQGYLVYRAENKQVGLWLNHESFGKGPIRDEQSAYGFTEVMISGGIQKEGLSFAPKVYYQGEGYYPYGYDAENSTVDYQDLKIGASTFSIALPVVVSPVEPLSFSVVPSYQAATMKFQDQDPFNTENQFQLSGDIDYELSGGWKVGALTSVQYLGYEGGIQQNRTIFEANPSVSFAGDHLKGHIGVRYFAAGGNQTTSQSYLLMDIGASYQVNEKLRAFASIDGDLEPVSLESMQMQNPYLDDSLTFLNQAVPLRLKAGVELSISDQHLLKPYIAFQETENKGLFMHSTQDTSRFLMVYDSGKFSTFSIGLESRLIISPKTTLMTGIKYSVYSPSAVAEPWYLPSFRLNAIGYHQLGDALTLKANLTILGGITAPEPITMRPITLDPIVGFGVGARYDFTKKLSAFMDLDNVFGANNERYLNYPVRGFMIKGGLSYQF